MIPMTKCHFIGGSYHGHTLQLEACTDCIRFPRPSKTGWDTFDFFLDDSIGEFKPVAIEYYYVICRFADVAVYIGEAITDAHRKATENLRWFTRATKSPAVGYALWMESCFSESLETDLTFQLRLMCPAQEFGSLRYA